MVEPGTDAPALVFALHSEDSADAKTGFSILEQVLCGMLKLVDGHTRLHHIRFSPTAQAIPGSLWKVNKSKEKGARDKRRILIEMVVRALQRGQIVFFHVDGDCAWKQQKRAEVWNHLERFRKDLITKGRAWARSDLIDIDEALLEQAFLVAVPFYSMESWLFANTAALQDLTRDARERETIAGWQAELGLLDEVPRIKEALPSIRDRHNGKLAAGVPCAALVALNKSYAATVTRLSGSKRLRDSLAASAARPW